MLEKCDKKPPDTTIEIIKKHPIACLILFGFIFGLISNITGSSSGVMPSHAISKMEVFVVTQGFVKEALKSPGTANFPAMDYSFSDHGNNIWTIESYVDSQNDFGATVRTNYNIKARFTGEVTKDWADISNWTLEDISLG